MPESDLLSVGEAIAVLDSVPVAPRILRVGLEHAQGLHLAEELRSDRDYPPFDKSLMDGYAVQREDVHATPVELEVIGEVAAGQQAVGTVGRGQAMAIMTGAPIPPGADGVVPVENVEQLAASSRQQAAGGGQQAAASSFCSHRVRILSAEGCDRFIAHRGSDCPAGSVVLPRGTKLEAAQLAVAASVGAAQVVVYERPRVAVLSTGDELVPIDATPGPAQIRNSNNIMLVALLRRLGCAVTDLGTIRDDFAAIRQAISNALSHDILFVTGGMSMGEYDYVPKVLLDLGVELKITKLRIKPGKPFVFGISGQQAAGEFASCDLRFAIEGSPIINHQSSIRNHPLAAQTYIFGLPGNPVSSFVCALRLCSRLIARMSGAEVLERRTAAILTSPLEANGSREFYQPAILERDRVTPLKWKGSADIYTLAAANGLIVRPEHAAALAAGQTVDVLEIPT